MKFLVIVQDLRISGTSEGIVSRSFLSRLKAAYPASIIEVYYLKNHQNDDELNLLPVDKIHEFYIDQSIPWSILWANKIYWRILNHSLKEKYIQSKYRKIIREIKIKDHDHIFIRSSGQGFETFFAVQNLPLLKKAILNFHDPFPVFWDTGSDWGLDKLELNKLRSMWKIVSKSKVCMSPSTLLSQDFEHLYGSKKAFKVLPHQFDPKAFPEALEGVIRRRKKAITISYHGAIQLGRNIDIFLDSYLELLDENSLLSEKTEVVLRIRGNHTGRLKSKYIHPNIEILDTLDFVSSAREQKEETDLVLILENCSTHSNILVGKAPFLSFLQKPVLSLSPLRSEMNLIVQNKKYIAQCNSKDEIKEKLYVLLSDIMEENKNVKPFGDYFSEENFNAKLEGILSE